MREGGSASNLAVVERKETRRKPGGCIGVFFQLFDWKKKKQFPKKLFPPGTCICHPSIVAVHLFTCCLLCHCSHCCKAGVEEDWWA